MDPEPVLYTPLVRVHKPVELPSFGEMLWWGIDQTAAWLEREVRAEESVADLNRARLDKCQCELSAAHEFFRQREMARQKEALEKEEFECRERKYSECP